MPKPIASDFADDRDFWVAYRDWQARQVFLANQRSERIRRSVECAAINAACLTQTERTALLGGVQ